MISSPSSRTFEHYKVLTDFSGQFIILSSDGSGVTYRARDTRNEKSVILRVFSEELLSDCSVQSDFVKNAKSLIELDHPSITRIVDTGQSMNQFFYVLQDPGGATVQELVERDGPLAVSKTLRLHSKLSEDLIGLRTQSRLPSRVWPRNLIISPSESTGMILVAQNLVTPTVPIECPEYQAPEILAGHHETAQTTLYSIGATLYFMLTGKPPFAAMSQVENLLELKSSQRADVSLLPPSAPITLIKQLLEPDPRNRPKSLIEWDRALKHFIRFTPNTGAMTVNPNGTSVSATEPIAASYKLSKAPSHQELQSFVTDAATSNITQVDSELRKAKVHTQRLSLELTKRVQKELALTEQLEILGAELEQEREALRSLREEGPKGRKKSANEVSELESQWETLRKARKDLEREKKEFLKKTQRFSLQQLKAEAIKTSPAPSKFADESQAKEENVQTEKPRLFRLRKCKTTAPVQTQKTHEASEKSRPPSQRSSELPQKVVAKPPKTTPGAVKPSTTPEIAIAQAPREPAKVLTPFSVPVSDTKKAVKATTARQPNAKRTARPTPHSSSKQTPTAGKSGRVVTFATPFSKGTKAPTTNAVGSPQPLTRRTKSSPSSSALQQEVFERQLSARVSDEETSKIAAMPDMEPTRGAWGALSLLGLVIGIGLFMVYRTFFSTNLLGSPQKEPLRVDYSRRTSTPLPRTSEENGITMPAAKEVRAEKSADDSVGGVNSELRPGAIKFTEKQAPVEDKLNDPVEDKLNEELRVEMRVFDNFLLLQDQEWAELLHGLKNLERQADKYSPKELNQIRNELVADLQRTAQLKKDNPLEENKGYQELLSYLLSVVDPNENQKN